MCPHQISIADDFQPSLAQGIPVAIDGYRWQQKHSGVALSSGVSLLACPYGAGYYPPLLRNLMVIWWVASTLGKTSVNQRFVNTSGKRKHISNHQVIHWWYLSSTTIRSWSTNLWIVAKYRNINFKYCTCNRQIMGASNSRGLPIHICANASK